VCLCGLVLVDVEEGGFEDVSVAVSYAMLIPLSALTPAAAWLYNLAYAQHNMEHQTLSFSTTSSAALQIAQIVRLCELNYVSKFGAF
jgi:hypothetical protein